MTEEQKKPQHCEKELAQFIRSGATRRPDQAFGDYYRGRSASCEWFFDCLEGSVRRCPHGNDCKKTLSLAAIMVHLNDDHKWSREQIAQWLESLK
jgi:hypothetical protein